MSVMGMIEAQEVLWFAVRTKPNDGGGPRTVLINVEKERYKTRAGVYAYRAVKGSGERVNLAEQLLKRSGFEVFLPKKKVWRIKNRFTKEKHLVSVPLLADWMFVGIPIVSADFGRIGPGWMRLMDLGVVAGVMGTGGRPILMRDKAMTKIMRRFGTAKVEAAAKHRIEARRAVAVGEVGTILDGPFEHFDAKVIDIAGANVKAIVNLFGRDTPITLQVGQMAKRAAD